MKHFQLAIASIVDANTGYGIDRSDRTDYRQEERHSHVIRSKSVHALLGAIAGMLRNAVANYRERARERRAIADLTAMNEHFLKDIGLTRGDIVAVRLGQTSLEELNADRRARLAVAPLDYVATGEVDTYARRADARNAADYAEVKCA